jgi:nucleoside-diphosphate-sugar epimerase
MNEDNYKKILITGGAGYIGSVLTGLLLRSGFKVRVIDNFTFGGESLLSYLPHPDFELVHGDICSNNDVGKALEGITGIVHLAAIVGDPACKKNPEWATMVNKIASEKLCNMAIEVGIKRFVFVSTCSNYGKMDDMDSYVDEKSPLNPVSHYAELKVGFEKYLMSLENKEFAPVCLRFATAYGMSPRPRFDLTVNEFCRELFLGRELEVYGEQFWRPYCHTRDLANACRLALMASDEKVAYQTFNVGHTNENYTKKDLVDLILCKLPQSEDKVTFVDKKEDPRDYRVNCDKIRKALKFIPVYTVKDGINELINVMASGVIANPDYKSYRNL